MILSVHSKSNCPISCGLTVFRFFSYCTIAIWLLVTLALHFTVFLTNKVSLINNFPQDLYHRLFSRLTRRWFSGHVIATIAGINLNWNNKIILQLRRGYNIIPTSTKLNALIRTSPLVGHWKNYCRTYIHRNPVECEGGWVVFGSRREKTKGTLTAPACPL